MTKVGAMAAAVVLTMGLSACGDDDDDATDTTEADAGGEAAAPDTAEFCSSLVEFNAAVNQVELDDDASEDEVIAVGEELDALWQGVEDNAPEAVSDAADELGDTALEPLLEGEAEAFNSDETFAAYTDLVGQSVGECQFGELAVTAVDYAFQGVPATLPAGTYAPELTNEGSEQHEMIVFRKAPGVTEPIAELLELPEEEAGSKFVFAGAAFAPPGDSGAALVELEPGDYAMVCFIPVGSVGDAPPEDSEGDEGGAPHFTQGMVAEFTVE
jgi:hypothetical protein